MITVLSVAVQKLLSYSRLYLIYFSKPTFRCFHAQLRHPQSITLSLTCRLVLSSGTFLTTFTSSGRRLTRYWFCLPVFLCLSLFTSAKAELMQSARFVCHSVSVQPHAKSYARIYVKFLPKAGLGPVSSGLILEVIGLTFTVSSQRTHKRLVNVYIMFTIAFRIGSECPFIERLFFIKTFS